MNYRKIMLQNFIIERYFNERDIQILVILLFKLKPVIRCTVLAAFINSIYMQILVLAVKNGHLFKLLNNINITSLM